MYFALSTQSFKSGDRKINFRNRFEKEKGVCRVNREGRMSGFAQDMMNLVG